MSKQRTKLLPSERTSVTISRTIQDDAGNQTSSRTNYSSTKSVQQVPNNDESTNNEQQTLAEMDKKTSKKSSSTKTSQKRKNSKPTESFTQIPLFPTSE